jgi:glutathione synthase/RimK-type ligase-like ATP-grasp enzyme
MNNILAITNFEDAHIPLVQKHLDDEIMIFDASKFPDNTDISYEFKNGRFEIKSEDRLLSSVTSVWFRKPNYLEPQQLPVDDELIKFTHQAYTTGAKALYDLMYERFWLSDYRNIMKANNKLFQLEKAYDVDFLVPSTLVTSKAEDAIRFTKQYKNVIAKSFHSTPVEINGEYKLFYTARITPEDDIDFSGLSLAPAIFQEEVRNKNDVRITIVGNQIFPCLITPKESMLNEVDWRIGIQGEEVNYEPFGTFPDHMKTKCLDYLKKLGLSFGVIEFALDEKGNYWFLEINPNGQWGFIEEETGMNISSSIAEILQKGGKI